MALSVTPQASPLGARLVEQTVTNATPVVNAIGGAGSLYMIDIDNSANGSPVWLKFFDNANPTVGTTPADYVVRVAANTRRAHGIIQGTAFTFLSFACVTAADQASVASPALPVITRLLTS